MTRMRASRSSPRASRSLCTSRSRHRRRRNTPIFHAGFEAARIVWRTPAGSCTTRSRVFCVLGRGPTTCSPWPATGVAADRRPRAGRSRVASRPGWQDARRAARRPSPSPFDPRREARPRPRHPALRRARPGNAAATAGVAAARELTVRVLDEDGELAAGVSGWTWGVAAGIALTWVREDAVRPGSAAAADRLRGGGPGPGLRPRLRHVVHVPGAGVLRAARLPRDLPVGGRADPEAADVHLRKDL